jgi:membrane protein implicated in regulation of membrane protease activity
MKGQAIAFAINPNRFCIFFGSRSRLISLVRQLTMSIPLLWLIAGCILCLLELIFPTAFVEFMMGISAILIAAIALVIPYLTLQVILWLVLSATSIALSRRFLTPKPKLSRLTSDTEGETITEITPGQAGRVLYEGNSWRAVCADENLAIAPREKVYIVERKGNTLIILPARLNY